MNSPAPKGGLMTHSFGRLMWLIVTALLIAALAAGCGIPDDDEPRNIDPQDVQYDLLAPSTTAPPTPGPVVATADIYLLGPDNRLVVVRRQLPEARSIGAVLGVLLQGAASTEIAAGLRSALDERTVVNSAQVVNGVAQIDVSEELLGLSPQDQIRAIAQIVYTATSVEGIRAVQITVKSQPVELPRSDGSLTSGELLRSDYTALAPPS